MTSEIDRLRQNVFNNLQEIEKLEQENKQLKEQLANDIDRYEDTISYQLGYDSAKALYEKILIELEEYIKKHIEEWENDEDEYLNGVVAEDKDILQLIQELKENYK